MRKIKVCKRGHRLTKKNITGGACLACKRLNRGWQGGPANSDKTKCPRGHRYTGENLSEYEGSGRKMRLCKQCRRERAAEYYRNKVKPLHHPGPRGRPRKLKPQEGETNGQEVQLSGTAQ